MKKAIFLIWILTLGITPLSLAIDGPWTIKTDMPTARMYPSNSVVDGKIYAMGGASEMGVGISVVEEYDPATDVWTEKSPMPTPRWGFATSTVDGKIYVIGGAEGHPGSSSKIVEEYNPATDTWTTKSPMPTARWGLSTSVVNGKIYAIGGGIPSGYNVMEEYDPSTDTWASKASMRIGRYALSTSVVNGKIYVIGGTTSYPTSTATVEEYDPTTDSWVMKASMAATRTYFSTSIAYGKIYAIGGSRDADGGPVSVVEEYDPSTDSWIVKGDMLTARVVLSTCTVNGKIYAIGGSTRAAPWNTSAAVEEYDPYPIVVDFNGDGIVNSADVCIMIDYWGTDEPLCDIGPMPWGDGIVDVQDLIVLAEHLFEDYRLVAHWKLDEMTGDNAYDSAVEHDGTLNGEPLWQPNDGQVVGALELDGIDDYISVPFILNPGKESIGAFAWIKGGWPGQVIISQTNGTGWGGSWLCADSSNGRLATALMDPLPALESESVITDGAWHHIGLVWDKSYRYLYVDGAEVAKDVVALSYVMPCDGGLYLGASKNLDADSFFSGFIDDVRIYNKALSADEIAALAQ